MGILFNDGIWAYQGIMLILIAVFVAVGLVVKLVSSKKDGK